ncbi:alpha/beta fold hydrolase [Desulfuromonas acetoxidans]|uniref:AB hydrolase-1 domain-containing protein n=1 Tax=Desulfuromonas acetoxidans (strain DSM 684 / 11070) TaxID=281689 RepID=Q1JYA4_DESA6|nr:alpha/beta fold hydrolase [Desulfuromonas acetoxidans]EAT15302.1 hypothetical protein Dace_1271 [Desulfuromonas acetoxidans DSM 684]MBF0645589.1 alpha/beta fold hydrolase [Desulfuromonas acetoxidans]NVD23391.1 alpha/beta fold hydrolase [Desulfuromonas acetoxidans]NVE15368.1 alpha/beta fold hydrolase [Desulfuromonas acetoxidans]
MSRLWFNRFMFITTLILVSSLILSCTPATRIPLPLLTYTQPQQNPNLLVILRGIGGSAEDFERLGAIAAVRQRNLPFDVVVPDAHFGYYKKQTLVDRLYEDVIQPARQQGYQHIWLAGFSMGGLGSLIYVREHPEDIDGILLITPFLGWDGIIHEIKDAGGVSVWQPGTFDPADDWQRMVWSWIKEYQHALPLGPPSPPIYLGYGQDDSIADEGPPLLATVLPPCNSFHIPGGHDYEVMLTIFRRHLDTLRDQFPVDTP